MVFFMIKIKFLFVVCCCKLLRKERKAHTIKNCNGSTTWFSENRNNSIVLIREVTDFLP